MKFFHSLIEAFRDLIEGMIVLIDEDRRQNLDGYWDGYWSRRNRREAKRAERAERRAKKR